MFFNTILFDLDDTLHDRDKSLSEFIKIFKDKYSHMLCKKSKQAIDNIFLEIDERGYKSREVMFKELLDRTSWSVSPDISELMDFWNMRFPECAAPMNNLHSTLGYFKQQNIKLGIITNGGTDFQYRKIDKLDLKKYMDTIIISEEVKVRKPDRAIFELALSKLKGNKINTIFVGDNPEWDIKGAIDAGLIAVWISNGQSWEIKNYSPNFIINDLSELKDICKDTE